MRKERLKAIRAHFKALMGRPLNGIVVKPADAQGLIAYTPSEKRRVKKAYLKAHRHGLL